MPRPASVKLTEGTFNFTPQFTIGIEGPESEKLTAAVNRFYSQIGKRTGIYFPQEYITPTNKNPGAQLVVSFQKAVLPQIGMDESYHIAVTHQNITLTATTDIGAIRGLETLYQLIMQNGSGYYCPVAEISDYPRFKWRGLMIDAARHFIPIEVLKRNIEAMAIVKMNVLHLHLSDDEGFRVESKVYPKLQQLGSNGQFYTQDQIKDLVNFAHERGIIVIPEFDLPGHSTSLLAAYPFLASYPANYRPAKRYKMDTVKNLNMMKLMKIINQSPLPTIDPTKESTYIFFDHFIAEMSTLFPDQYFHVGADENNGVAWDQNPAIVAFMKANNIKNTNELQAYFVKRMYAIAKKHNKQLIGWEEAYNQDLPSDVIIEKWKPSVNDTLTNHIIHHGNPVIVSNGYYLDLSLPAYIQYLSDPVHANVSKTDADKGITGGEAALWGELANSDNEEIKAWPRAAAVAEGMWSAPNVTDVDDMYRRLWSVDYELNNRAIGGNYNYEKILSTWINSNDIAPIKTLTDVCVPVKGYRRLMNVMLTPANLQSNLASPLSGIADVAYCDSKTRWQFRQLIGAYLAKHDTTDLNKIKDQLIQWQDNNFKFTRLAKNSPYLQQIQELSIRLSSIASIGLTAINTPNNSEALLKQFQQYQAPLFEVQFAILPEIEALITGKLKAEPVTYTMF